MKTTTKRAVEAAKKNTVKEIEQVWAVVKGMSQAEVKSAWGRDMQGKLDSLNDKLATLWA